MILAIDPGQKQSGWVLWSPGSQRVTETGEYENERLFSMLAHYPMPVSSSPPVLVVEKVVHYGKTVGVSTFDTCEWSGQFVAVWKMRGWPWGRMPWRDVARTICDTTVGVREEHVRQALVDRFADGDLKTLKGSKQRPGPFYGVAGHGWSALALAIAWQDTQA